MMLYMLCLILTGADPDAIHVTFDLEGADPDAIYVTFDFEGGLTLMLYICYVRF